MADYARNPLVNFNFVLRVEALYDLPCKSVKAFSRANEFEYVQEGGLNDYVHMLRKPISQPFTFQVERYVGVQLLDPLTLGTELVLPVVLMVNRMYGDSQTVRYYLFTGCTVIAKDYGELDSERSGLLTETTTISYRELFCLDFPTVGGSAGTWEFDETTKAGKGKQSAKHVAGEASKADFEKNAVLWKFKGTEKKGKGKQSAAPNPKGELSKAEMEKLGRKWPKTKSAADIASYLSSTAKPTGRKWPKTKSAVGTDAYLTSSAEPTGRKWPPTKSAVSYTSPQ